MAPSGHTGTESEVKIWVTRSETNVESAGKRRILDNRSTISKNRLIRSGYTLSYFRRQHKNQCCKTSPAENS